MRTRHMMVGGAGIGALLAFWFGLVIGPIALVAIWTDRTLEFWMTHFKGVETEVPYWLSFLVTLFLNAIILGVNIISEVVRLFIG